MKALLTLITAYAMCMHIAHAQSDESGDFLYLYSDSVIHANRIDLERDPAGSFYLWVDSRRIHPDQVKFFNNNRGFFANVKDFDVDDEITFSERIRKGKVNLYEAKRIKWLTYDSIHGYTRNPTVVQTKNYYNLGYGNLKKVNYVNLSSDLASNPKSIELLKKYRSVQRKRTILYTSAVASFLAGVVLFSIDTDASSSDLEKRHDSSWRSSAFTGIIPAATLSVLGFGLIIKSNHMGPSKTRYLKQAIDVYNE
ncbi:hypothetical protein [Arcticibacter tournemirensis]|uniref:Uncharacterized protein n=1 Tax=Arcticibacter tournemirensis TaxID=699437 RepID=A0A4V1KIG6_9SPHI|nr:hypothetical protein [Arcticibacter tournemirensis]RXF70622.1 hypothetical protein EKH83_08255 [Arcticibacter tournemirensis]